MMQLYAKYVHLVVEASDERVDSAGAEIARSEQRTREEDAYDDRDSQ